MKKIFIIFILLGLFSSCDQTPNPETKDTLSAIEYEQIEQGDTATIVIEYYNDAPKSIFVKTKEGEIYKTLVVSNTDITGMYLGTFFIVCLLFFAMGFVWGYSIY